MSKLRKLNTQNNEEYSELMALLCVCTAFCSWTSLGWAQSQSNNVVAYARPGIIQYNGNDGDYRTETHGEEGKGFGGASGESW